MTGTIVLSTLLTTKLSVPPVQPNLVPRSHLVDRLNEGLARKLTLVSAPAGFGKTTLVGEWVDQSDVPVAWVSLDEDDNDITRFLSYVVAALQTIKPGIGEAVLAALQLPQPPRVEQILSALINEIAEIPNRFVLVLDDYHLIEAAIIQSALTFLLDHLPQQMHLIIATRADPPLPIARLRARGQLAEIRAAGLRFTDEETVNFLHAVTELEFSAEDVAALESRTEGWIAGLQLAALSMQGAEDPSRFIADFSGSHEYIADYLADEVLGRQPEDIRAFLLQTSILKRLTGPLCDAVTGRQDSQQILERLKDANLFVVPLDHERRWYRYHRLFADLLRQRLRSAYPDYEPELHHRASEWCEQNGHVNAAINHALASQDHDRAAYLLEQVAESVLMRGELTTFLNWTAVLPDQVVCARPLLCVHHIAALLLSGQALEDVEALLLYIVEADVAGKLAGEIATVRALIATYRGDGHLAIDLAQQALELLPSPRQYLRSVVMGCLGLVYHWSGDLETAIQTFEQILQFAQRSGNIAMMLGALRRQARLYVHRGKLHEAQALYEQALELAVDTKGQPLPIAGFALMGLGELRREWNDLESAAHYLQEAIELVEHWGEVGAIEAYASLARVRQAHGEFGQAHAALDRAMQLARKTQATDADDHSVAMHRARVWISQGNLSDATRWANQRGLDRKSDPDDLEADRDLLNYHLRRYEYPVMARLLIAQDRPDEALVLLEKLLPWMEQEKRTGMVIEILALKALALKAQGSDDQALDALEQALHLAEPGGYVRIFVDEGPRMAHLLYEVAAQGIAPEYTGRLLAAFPTMEPTSMPRDARTDMVEPLSERELEVLQLIAVGLSNREIAQRLVLSLGTIKVHTRNIYGKLGVNSRTQAVARAKTLGIL